MSEIFCDYLMGSKVTVVTDNNPLCYILKTAKLDATCHRWLASLSLFDFELRYKKGSTHTDADALSRRPHDPPEEDDNYQKTMEQVAFWVEKAKAFDTDFEAVSTDSVRAVLQAHKVSRRVHSCHQGVNGDRVDNPIRHVMEDDDNFIPAVEQIAKDPSLIPDDVLEPKGQELDSISRSEWRKLQLADKNVGLVIQSLVQKTQLVASVRKSGDERVC